MKKIILVILIMTTIITPENENITLVNTGFFTIDDVWRVCYYKKLNWFKEIPYKNTCPPYIILNRSTGGWTH